MNTGYRKPMCINGHPRIPENLYAGGNCKICTKERTKINKPIWIKQNPDKVKAQQTAWLLKRPEEQKQKANRNTIKWRTNNPEKAKQFAKENSVKMLQTASNAYIASLFGASVKEIPADLIEFRRAILFLKRRIKNADHNKSLR